MYQSILVPFDGSRYAQNALEVACRLADSEQATIIMLSVAEMLGPGDSLGRSTGALPMDKDREELENTERAKLEQTWDALDQPKAHPEFLVRWGQPARAIVAEAEAYEVDAIVMGGRGSNNFQSMMVGSVSHKVMHIAPCRVITVH